MASPATDAPTLHVDTARTQAQAQAPPPATPQSFASPYARGPLYQPSVLAFDPDHEHKVVHREQVANPAPLGLFAFGLTTALLQGANTAITEKSTSFFVYAYALFYGGLAQLLAGMWEFKRQNTFGAVAFSSYGAFWMSFSIFGILASAGIFEASHKGEKMLLSLWGILTFILMVPTLELNFALFLLFFTLSILFWLLAGGLSSITFTRIGGWWGLFVAGVAFYIAAADLINEQYERTVLPLGKWSVGVPMAKRLKGMLGTLPLLGKYYVRGCNREDRMGGINKKTDAKDAEGCRVHAYQLHTPGSYLPTSFEGAAVRDEQRYAPQGSGIGPF